MQLVQLDMKQISSEAEIYDCLVGQMNFTNADEKPEWMNVIEMNERDPYEMDTEEQPEDPECKKNLDVCYLSEPNRYVEIFDQNAAFIFWQMITAWK